MYDEHEQLDEDLAQLARTLRSADVMMACMQLAEFALKLDRIIRCEERALTFAADTAAPNPLAKVRSEHASLRRMVSLVASALDRGDYRRSLEIIGKLRSVLLLHIAKEAALEPFLHHA